MTDQHLPGIEVDRRCAALLGWHRGTGGAIIGGPGFESPSYWYDQHGRQMEPALTDTFANMRAWSPTSQPLDARQLEDEIERRGLQAPYIQTLIRLIKADGVVFSSWQLLRVRPELRARAFITAMEQ